MCALHEQWAAEDPEAAANYFHGQGEGGQPSGVLSSVMVTWGAADPVAAITWIMTLPGNEMERFLPSAVASWAGEDPVLAARYVLKFQSGEFRNRLIQEVVARWAMRDAESVAKWVSTNHFEEAVLVRAYPSIIFYWAQRNPDQASLWIDTLPEGMPRVKALEAMARALRENVVSP